MHNNDLPDDGRVKSRPIYVPPDTPTTASRYIGFAETEAAGLVVEYLSPIDKSLIPVHLFICTEKAGAGQDVKMPELNNVTWQTSDRDSLASTLATLLKDATLGCHVVVAGSEAFLWDVHAYALTQGLLDAEITLLTSGEKHRRVFCAHCHTLTEPVTVSPAACDGCGHMLEVRDHFSRRLGAYMGVRIDAEIPGEIPPEEVLN